MKIGTFTFLAALLCLTYSCETKVDLVAEGEESPIVYGFIDATADTQFVKITKSFITEGNAFQGAMDPSLSEYEDLDAYIVEYDGSDSVNAFMLKEKTITNKDSGVFYYPVQTVYYTDEIGFGESNDPRYDHTFEIAFTGSGKDVSSKTDVIHPFVPSNTVLLSKVRLVTFFDPAGSNYTNLNLVVNQQENAKRYEFTLRFHYVEHYIDGTFEDKYLDFLVDDWITDGLSGNESQDMTIKGEEFFQRLANRIAAQDNEENVTKRVIRDCDYIFEYAGFDLNTYIELNQPATSFNSEQNPYSNITNGVGVWSARGASMYDKEIEIKTIQEIALGQYTYMYKFCSDDPGHTDQPYGCN